MLYDNGLSEGRVNLVPLTSTMNNAGLQGCKLGEPQGGRRGNSIFEMRGPARGKAFRYS